MPPNRNPSKDDNPSTYVIYASKKKAELHRLLLQDRMITTAMGGVLPEQTEPGDFHRVLDVGCGTGGWLLEAAQTYPAMKLVGVDINKQLIAYAQSQSEAQGLKDRVEFQMMDVLHELAFPKNSFDLVNLRYGTSYVRTWDWPKLLLEMQQVTRPGGMIRVTDCEVVVQSTSSALTQFCEMFVRALYRAGHLFTEEGAGLTNHLAELLTNSWCEEVQTKAYPLEFGAGTPEAQSFVEDMRSVIQTSRPFIQKWVGIPKDYDTIYRQACKEMEQPDFHATWPHWTAWGSKPLSMGK